MSSVAGQMPAPSYGGMIPTLNQRGFMLPALEEYSRRFVEYAAELAARDQAAEVLDIGCAYGVATLAALERGARVLAVDMEPGHVEILAQRTPPGHRARLRTGVAVLPDADFERGAFAALLAARVLHFLEGRDVRAVIGRMRTWLRPGGKAFLIADTPYTGYWTSLAGRYEERKRDPACEWPGFIDDIRPLFAGRPLPEGTPLSLNPMDADILARECERAGFVVESAAMFGKPDGPQPHCGVVARVPGA